MKIPGRVLFAWMLIMGLIGGVACQPTSHPKGEIGEATESPASVINPAATAFQNEEVSELAHLSGLSFDEFIQASYQELLLRDPELVLELGLESEFGIAEANLTDISDEFIRQTNEFVLVIQQYLLRYDRAALTPEQRITFDAYNAYLEDRSKGIEFMYNDYPVTFLVTNGVQVKTKQFFVDIHPVSNLEQAQDYITRLGQVGNKFDQLIESLELRKDAGIVAPALVLQWSLSDIWAIASSSPDRTPYYSAFEEKINALQDVSDQDRQALLKDAERAIKKSVLPAYKKLGNYLEDLKADSPAKDGVWQFENGEAYYAYLLSRHTTTDLSAQEIHDLGLSELERIQAEMWAIFDQMEYPADWSLPNLYRQAAQDNGFVSGADMPGVYETHIRQAETKLDTAFGLIPQTQVIVIGGPNGDYYVPASLDGARPGAFYANTSSGSPAMNMATLAYHETVPGHHLQIALAQEIDLPAFQSVVDFTAYTEGWALYSERLAYELGWYEDDPYGDLGRLQAEAFRAARLAVDTGIHSKGWTFDQAVDFMVENTGLPTGMVQGEVGRYIAWPGQATAYKIGMLKILDLRQRAMDQLGDQFDLQEFHRLILSNGALPLDVVEDLVQNYIDAKSNQ